MKILSNEEYNDLLAEKEMAEYKLRSRHNHCNHLEKVLAMKDDQIRKLGEKLDNLANYSTFRDNKLSELICDYEDNKINLHNADLNVEGLTLRVYYLERQLEKKEEALEIIKEYVATV